MTIAAAPRTPGTITLANLFTAGFLPCNTMTCVLALCTTADDLQAVKGDYYESEVKPHYHSLEEHDITSLGLSDPHIGTKSCATNCTPSSCSIFLRVTAKGGLTLQLSLQQCMLLHI